MGKEAVFCVLYWEEGKKEWKKDSKMRLDHQKMEIFRQKWFETEKRINLPRKRPHSKDCFAYLPPFFLPRVKTFLGNTSMKSCSGGTVKREGKKSQRSASPLLFLSSSRDYFARPS